MKQLIKNFIYIVWMGVLTSISSCSKDFTEITSLETSRLFSPIELEVRVVNQTGVRLQWNAVKNAASYELEFYEGENPDFSGTSVRTVADIRYDQLPYTVTGFLGETDYTVRVRAVGEDISESKWITATFSTDPEQIFRTVDISDIEATAVTLRWTAGEAAEQIVLEPGNIQYTVTAADIAAGVAQITGLSPETNYTARLMYEGRTRGTISFRTILDLGDAIAVESTDDLTSIIANATAGDIFALMPGEYDLQDLAVSKSISIKAAVPSDRPVLKGAVLKVSDNAALTLENLILDGTGAVSNNQTIIYEVGDNYGSLIIDNCEIYNYVKGALYVNGKTLIESVSITNTIYHDIECNGGDFIDFRQGMAKTFTFTNNTVSNSTLARDMFRMDANGSTNYPAEQSIINISNNTFSNVINTNTDTRRMLYIRLATGQHSITFTKNIVSNSPNGSYAHTSANVTTSTGNNYFNADNYHQGSAGSTKNDTGSPTTYNPGFANPGAGDFTISHEDLLFHGIGDARWRNP